MAAEEKPKTNLGRLQEAQTSPKMPAIPADQSRVERAATSPQMPKIPKKSSTTDKKAE